MTGFSRGFKQRLLRACLLCAAMQLFCLGFGSIAHAQLTILHSFGTITPVDGAFPFLGLTQAPNGDIYVPAGLVGGTRNQSDECVFQYTTTGAKSVVYIVGYRNILGAALFPYMGGLVGVTAPPNPKYGFGQLFHLEYNNKTGIWRKTVWHYFGLQTPKHDGQLPEAPVILGSDGYLYGTTFVGGNANGGTIYKFNPVNLDYKVLHRFDPNTEGVVPEAALLLAQDGNYYGTTTLGKNSAKGGTIFRMTPAGVVSTIYTFTDGSVLQAPLIQTADGNFYGTTVRGASGPTQSGTVFKMSPAGVITILHAFGQGSDGSQPSGTVVQGPNGNLYGATSFGGTGRKEIGGDGIIFEITTDGSSYTVLHNFDDGTIPNDGIWPTGLILGLDNNLYGTTFEGGSVGEGTLFKYSP